MQRVTDREDHYEAGRRLGLSWINIAQHGVKSHLGKMVSDTRALLIFDRPKTRSTMVALWDLEQGKAITSTEEGLNFPSGMLLDWDWRAEAIQAAFERLAQATPEEAILPTP